MSIETVLSGLLPELAEKARIHLARCETKGIQTALTSGRRSWQEQMTNYAKGREMTSHGWIVKEPALIVTNALPDHAPHCRGAAYDVCPVVDEQLAWDRLDLFSAIHECAHDLGLVWGGLFLKLKDCPHYELPFWRDLPLEEGII